MKISIRNEFQTIKEFDLTSVNLLTAVNQMTNENESMGDADCSVYPEYIFIDDIMIKTESLFESQDLSLAQKMIEMAQNASTDIKSIEAFKKDLSELNLKGQNARWFYEDSEHRIDMSESPEFLSILDQYFEILEKRLALTSNFNEKYESLINKRSNIRYFTYTEINKMELT